jgi:beta-glucanase (GH16 family)
VKQAEPDEQDQESGQAQKAGQNRKAVKGQKAGQSQKIGQAASKKTKPPKGMKLVWHDEFVGAAGLAPSAARWKIESGTPGTGEKEYNTPKNVGLDGQGHLVIAARRQHVGAAEYTSGRINTEGRFQTTYGRITARIKSPDGRGLIPAFWMLGSDYVQHPWPASGEIDIMERRGDLHNRSYATLQGPGYAGVGISRQYVLPNGGDFGAAFHLFTVDWTPSKITLMVDNHTVQSVKRSTIPGRWVFNHPFFIVLDLAVGSPFAGAPDAQTIFPAKMIVDYVRAYRFTAA